VGCSVSTFGKRLGSVDVFGSGCVTAVHGSGAKARRALAMVRRQFKELYAQSFLIIYKGFVRPHLEYAIQAWSPYLRRDIDCLERVHMGPKGQLVS